MGILLRYLLDKWEYLNFLDNGDTSTYWINGDNSTYWINGDTSTYWINGDTSSILHGSGDHQVEAGLVRRLPGVGQCDLGSENVVFTNT